MKEIQNIDDIKLLVDTFYGSVRQDQLIGHIFNGVVKDEWPRHLEKMYRFWQTVLLHEYTYKGRPFLPHAQLPVGKAHFDRWIKLFKEAVDQHFTGEKADEAKWRAELMAEMFYSKIKYYRDNSKTPLV